MRQPASVEELDTMKRFRTHWHSLLATCLLSVHIYGAASAQQPPATTPPGGQLDIQNILGGLNLAPMMMSFGGANGMMTDFTRSTERNLLKRHDVRSELFIAGVELSDGFGGLADPHLQMWFYEFMAARRRHENQGSVTLDQRYLDALKLGAPYGAGMALGFDRLIMLLTDQPTIKNVLAFAWDEV